MNKTLEGTRILDLTHMLSGLYAAMGVLAALLERERSGQGQHVDISMLDCQLSLLNYLVSMAGFNGRDPQPMGNAHSVHMPYNSYRIAARDFIDATLATAQAAGHTQSSR